MKARFAYYWQMEKMIPAVAKYRTEDGQEATQEELSQLGIPIPPTPTYSTWRNFVFSKKRCGFCWLEIDGTLSGLHAHVAAFHPARLAA